MTSKVNDLPPNWQEMLNLYNEMVNDGSPSQIAGDDKDPVDAIIALLNSPNPDWDQISMQLDNLQAICQTMITDAKNLPGTTAADLRTQLKNISLTIGNLQNVIQFNGGTNEFDPLFKSLAGFFTQIKQDILQG